MFAEDPLQKSFVANSRQAAKCFCVVFFHDLTTMAILGLWEL